MNIEDFKKETNSKFKQYREEYIKKLEGVLPGPGKRKSRNMQNADLISGDINQKFKDFVNELFVSSSENILQSNSINHFCKEFGMDREHLAGLRDFD